MAFLTGFGKALSNLSYVSLAPEDWKTTGCKTGKSVMECRQTFCNLSNSDEVVRDCKLPAPGTSI